MKKFYIFPLLFFFLSLSLLFLSLNQISADESLLIEHKSYAYNKKLNLHSYSRAEVKIKDLTVSADRLEYNPDDQILTFIGDIFIHSPKTLIMAERALLNRKDSTAVLYRAVLFDKINRTIIKAEKIQQTSPEKFIIEKGYLSFCPPDSPAWEIKSERIIYRLDNFAYSINTGLFFYKFPIFYTPFFSWPTANKRSAGLLIPSYTRLESSDSDKSYGHRLKIPYFLPFGQNHDLTITADIIEKRGVAAELDYQYAFAPGTFGKFKSWLLKEKRRSRSPNPNMDGDEFGRYPTRYSLSFDHKQNIFSSGGLFFHHRQNSDNEVNREYFESAAFYDYRFLTAASLVFPWDNGAFFINYEEGARFKRQFVFDQADSPGDYPAKVPSLSFFHRSNRVDGLPLSLGLSAGLTNYQKHENWAGRLSNVSVDVSYPFSLGFLNILPQYEKSFHHYQIYFSGNRRHPDQFGLFIERKKVELNFELFRFFYNRDKQADRKLSFRPSLIFDEIDDADQSLAYDPDNSSAPNFVRPVFSRRTLTLKWESVYRIKDRELFKLDLSQIYDFNTGDDILSRAEDQETEPGYPVSPLRIGFSFSPNSTIKGKLFYRYDYREKRVIESAINLSAFDDKLNVSYINNRRAYREADDSYHPKTQTLKFSQDLRLGEKFELFFKGSWRADRQDIQNANENHLRVNRDITDIGLSLTYKHSCYNITALYSEKIVYNMEESSIREELEKKIMLTLDIPFISGNNKVGANLPYQAEYIVGPDSSVF